MTADGHGELFVDFPNFKKLFLGIWWTQKFAQKLIIKLIYLRMSGGKAIFVACVVLEISFFSDSD